MVDQGQDPAPGSVLSSTLLFFFLLYNFVYLFLAVPGLCCRMDFSPVVVGRLLIAGASLAADTGLGLRGSGVQLSRAELSHCGAWA